MLSAERRAQLDGLLEAKASSSWSTLKWLGQGASGESPGSIKSEVAKLAFLRQLGAHEWDLSDLNPNRRKFLAQVGRRSTSQTLQRMPERRRVFKGSLAARCHLVLQNHFHWLISANAAIVDNNSGWSDSWQVNGGCRIWPGRTAGLIMIATMRNSWLRFLALACVAALYGGTLAPVCGAQELAQNPVLTQLTVLLGEVGVSVDAARFPIDSSDSSQEFHLRWTAGGEDPLSPSPLANPSTGELTVVTTRVTAGPAPQLRSLRLSTNRLFIAAVDAGNALRSWTIVPDPRIIRAESFGPDGVIEGQTLYRPDADLFVTIPGDDAIAGIHVYQPLWDGQIFHLAPLGSVPVR